MKDKHLRMKLATRAVLIGLLLGAAGMMKGFAQSQGALQGVFSISETQQVYFSQGNLQFRASTNTWRFATNQYDYIGNANANVSQTYSGWIDLFGWGTSGYNHGATCYQPWATSVSNSAYYAYGYSSFNLNNKTGKADWGYNVISNGGNQTNQWRTLTHNEWAYLFYTRNTSSGIRFVKATVNNVSGIIILPDNWNSSYYAFNNTNAGSANYSNNTINLSSWNTLESYGAVFLPASGFRDGTDVYGVDAYGGYQSSTSYNSDGNYDLYFSSGSLLTGGTCPKSNAQSVRLVCPVSKYAINASANYSEGGTIVGAGNYGGGFVCTMTATANSGNSFVNWMENGTVVSTDAAFSFVVTNERNLVANFVGVNDLLTYSYDEENHTATITGHSTDLAGQLFIPGAVLYNGEIYTVTKIGVKAFNDWGTLTGSLVIPSSVIEIENSAFRGCWQLSGTLTIGDNVTTIGYRAFESCRGFAGDLIIPNSVTSIGEQAFRYCSGFDGSLILSENLTSISKGAFQGCTGFSGFLIIPNSVTSISNNTFNGLSNISSLIVLPETTPTLGNSVFYNVPTTIPVYVPCGASEAYSAATVWSDFSNYNEICDYQFLGTISSNWNEASNWQYHAIPNDLGNAFINASCQLDEDATVASLTITNGRTLTINNNKTLRVNQSVTNNGSTSNLLVKDGAQLICNNSVKATVQKNIAAYSDNGGWFFISSPVVTNITPTVYNGLVSSNSNDYDLYFYDEPAHYWRNYKESDNSLYSGFNIEPLKGYLYANASPVTLSFAGTLQAGNSVTSSTLSCQANELKGYNLVGNPFPCNAYANRPYYVMNADGNTILATPVSTSEPIAPCTGIVVQAFDTEQNPTVTFSKTAPSTSNQGNLNIVLSQQVNRSNTVIDNAVVSFDEGVRLGKFYFMQQDANIYIPLGKEDYAIAFSDKQGEMPLNFKASKSGEYTITVNPEGVELGYLHLIDNMTGADVDLLGAGDRGSEPAMRAEGASYTFTAKTTDYESRFKLVFVANNVDGSSTGSETFAFIDASGNIIITTDVSDATLQVIDAMGRVVRTVGLSQCGSRIPIVGMTSGVYVLRLIDGEDVKVQKIVVR